jgi:tetratricopeptide (TPR) repeat protein
MHRFLLTTMTLGGALCMVASSRLPWYRIPVAGDRTAFAEFPTIQAASSPVESIFHVAAVLIVLATAAIWFALPQRRQWSVACAAGGLVFLLLFPHFQIAWQPTMSAQASWLQIQHENLTWFGGDIFRGQEQLPSPSRQNLYLSDSPRQIAVMKLPTWSLQELGLHRLRSLTEWLGYTNAFCQFMSAGWPLAVLGNGLILVATFFDRQRVKVLRIRMAVQSLGVMGLAAAAVGWYWPLHASSQLACAAQATQRGDHVQGLACLKKAARCWPPLKEDTWYVAQLGLTEHLVGVKSANSHLHVARMLERDQQFALALTAYRELVTTEAPGSAVGREACRGLLRHSIRSLNSGQLEQAKNGLRYVLRHEPCNIKALYGLHVIYRRLDDLESLRQVQTQLAHVYQHLSFPDRKIVLGKSRELAVGAEKALSEERPGRIEQVSIGAGPPLLGNHLAEHDRPGTRHSVQHAREPSIE